MHRWPLLQWRWINWKVQGSLNRWLKNQLFTIHRASRDACLLANMYHPPAGYYPDNSQQVDAYIIWTVGASSLRLYRWNCEGDHCAWNSKFNHATHLFNEPWNCSNHALVVNLSKKFCSVYILLISSFKLICGGVSIKVTKGTVS